MIRRTVVRLSMLVALSFPASAFSEQTGTDPSTVNDSGVSVPAPADAPSNAVSGYDALKADHEGMTGSQEEMSGDQDMGCGHRVDHHDPPFLMYTHVLECGEWMIGYRYTNSYMAGNQAGTTPLSNQQAFNAPGGGMYMMAPTSMTMEMHMLDIMRGITDDVTVYLMPTWTDDTMNMLMNDGTTFRMSNGGVGDLPFGALWRSLPRPRRRHGSEHRLQRADRRHQ